jgi:hypothetical protein
VIFERKSGLLSKENWGGHQLGQGAGRRTSDSQDPIDWKEEDTNKEDKHEKIIPLEEKLRAEVCWNVWGQGGDIKLEETFFNAKEGVSDCRIPQALLGLNNCEGWLCPSTTVKADSVPS